MKYILIIVSILFVFETPVFAEESTSTPLYRLPQNRQEIKQKIEEKKIKLETRIQDKQQEIKSFIEEKKEGQKTKLDIFTQQRVATILANIFERFDAVLVKFDGVVTRIESRITKLKEENVDTSASEKLLTQAKTKIEDATTLIAASKIELQTAITTQTSKQDIKDTLKICKTSLGETQQALISVITSLKGLSDVNDELLNQ
jgi:hypothetical protein